MKIAEERSLPDMHQGRNGAKMKSAGKQPETLPPEASSSHNPDEGPSGLSLAGLQLNDELHSAAAPRQTSVPGTEGAGVVAAPPGKAKKSKKKKKKKSGQKKTVVVVTPPRYPDDYDSEVDSDYYDSDYYDECFYYDSDPFGSDYSDSDEYSDDEYDWGPPLNVPVLYATDKPWEILEPFFKRITYNVSEDTFKARLPNLPVIKLKNVPPPGSEYLTAQEVVVQRAFDVALSLASDPSEQTSVALNAAKTTMNLALGGGIVPETICEIARLRVKLHLRELNVQEAEEYAAVGYVVGLKCGTLLLRSQNMGMFGDVWRAEGRFEDALIAYKAAITILQGTEESLSPTLMVAYAGIASIIREMGDRHGGAIAMLHAACWMLEVSATFDDRAREAREAREAQGQRKGGKQKKGERSPSEWKEEASNARRLLIPHLLEAAEWLSEPGASSLDKKRAEAALAEATAMSKRQYGRDSIKVLWSLEATAQFFRREGRMDLFFAVQDRQLEILADAPEVNEDMLWLRQFISVHRSIATGKAEAEDYQGAMQYIEKAIPKAKNGVNDGMICKHELGEIYDLLADFKRKVGEEAGAKAVIKKKQKALGQAGSSAKGKGGRTAKHKRRG